MTTPQDPRLYTLLERIAEALEAGRGPHTSLQPDWTAANAFVWHAGDGVLKPVTEVNAVPLDLLVGIEDQAETLRANTTRFARGLPANNALLWGARGMGKSSLVKAVHAAAGDAKLKLIEIHREDLASLPALLDLLRAALRYRFILFCDDLSFDERDASYKSLKTVLEGGIEGRPANVIFYATSNRRHLMPREMIENEQNTAIHRGEAVEEKVSLSDRFGLWLGFHPCSQDQYLDMVDRYAKTFKIKLKKADLHAQALEWAMTRGSRSGRVAWQFIQNIS